MQNVGSNYIAHEKLGTGATGDVWRGTDREGDPVAIKLLHAEFSGRRDVVHRFIQERNLLTDIAHPHVVRVRDLVYDRSLLAIVMDLVDGGDLAHLLHSAGALSLERTRAIAADIAMGLAAIHAGDIVHLDLKPANVLMHRDGDQESALIADLGVSQLAQGPAGVAEHPRFGTPQYTAPEVVSGTTVGSAADVYALALLMMEMLTGQPTFGGDDPDDVFAILDAQVSQEVERPARADDATWALLASMLVKDPDGRPTAAEVALSLGVPAETLDSTAFRGAASALGTSGGGEGTLILDDPDASGLPTLAGSPQPAGSRTVNLGHRTSILRTAQTVRLGARGSRTIALPAALQPGAPTADAPTTVQYPDRSTPSLVDETPPRRRRFMPLFIVLGLGVLVGAVSVGVLLTVRDADPPSPPASTSAGPGSDGEILVEDVTGMTEEDARAALGDQVTVEAVTVPGDEEQDGLVVATRPEAGGAVMPGDTVTLEVAEALVTEPLSSQPANTAGGRADQGAVTVGGERVSNAVVIDANTQLVKVTYNLHQRYTSVDTDLVVPDDATEVQVVVTVDDEEVLSQTVAPGERIPVTADVSGAQRIAFTVTSADGTAHPTFALADGVLGAEADA